MYWRGSSFAGNLSPNADTARRRLIPARRPESIGVERVGTSPDLDLAAMEKYISTKVLAAARRICEDVEELGKQHYNVSGEVASLSI